MLWYVVFLWQVVTNASNVDRVVDEVFMLTLDAQRLESIDVIYTASILESVATINNASQNVSGNTYMAQ